jgi:hypothetical protein
MTLTATDWSAQLGRSSLDLFRVLNEAQAPSTDPRRLAIARQVFPTARRDAPLDDDRGAMRLLDAVICTP